MKLIKPITSMIKFFSELKELGKLWPFLRRHKKNIIIAALLIPVISLLQMSLPLIVKHTIDTGIVPKQADEIYFGVLLGVIAVTGEYLARAAQTLVSAQAVHRMIQHMRGTLIQHIMKLSSKFHDHSMSGALVTRATSDFDNLSESLNQGVLTSVVDLAVLGGALIGLFVLNWKLALISLVILPIVVTVVVFFSKLLKKSMLIARSKIAALNAFTQECLYGIRTVKTLNGEAMAQEKLDKLAENYRKAQMKSVTSDALLFAILDGVSSITTGIVLWLAVTRLTSSDNLTVGVMVAFIQYIQNLFDPLKQLGNKIAMLQGAFTSLERIFTILDKKEFISGEAESILKQGSIHFRDVSFRYNKDDPTSHNVLNHISFDLPSGKSLALVGATGSGKSTVIKLLTKLYDGYEGEIQIDGQELKTIEEHSLREHIAIVPQDIVLFEGSVLFNITLGHENISRDDAIKAARLVGAESFIRNLSEGYDTNLKEGGANLSVGQRQLLAFARAIVKAPKIIVLDEATSSVDPKSEADIQRAITNILKDRTVIVIAHRLSTIRRCDEILVMKYGKIIERGSHNNLLSQKGSYYQLHSSMIDEQP
jgi:ATP-binding cassette subfamily B multidrug efflux pump